LHSEKLQVRVKSLSSISYLSESESISIDRIQLTLVNTRSLAELNIRVSTFSRKSLRDDDGAHESLDYIFSKVLPLTVSARVFRRSSRADSGTNKIRIRLQRDAGLRRGLRGGAAKYEALIVGSSEEREDNAGKSRSGEEIVLKNRIHTRYCCHL
jgi:hypothetical protein